MDEWSVTHSAELEGPFNPGQGPAAERLNSKKNGSCSTSSFSSLTSWYKALMPKGQDREPGLAEIEIEMLK